MQPSMWPAVWCSLMARSRTISIAAAASPEALAHGACVYGVFRIPMTVCSYASHTVFLALSYTHSITHISSLLFSLSIPLPPSPPLSKSLSRPLSPALFSYTICNTTTQVLVSRLHTSLSIPTIGTSLHRFSVLFTYTQKLLSPNIYIVKT